jgi:hypothetical protein
MGLMLDALTELEHLSLKSQDRKVTLPEAQCLISQKYCVSINNSKPRGKFMKKHKMQPISWNLKELN